MDRAVAALSLSIFGCGGAELSTGSPYASEIVRFEPGGGAGFGRERLPEIVLGPPQAGTGGASLDVLSLGAGGEIVLGFGAHAIADGPGPDLVVFENPFYVRGDPSDPYAELGEVSVSADLEVWHSFACNREGAGEGRWPGCAGWTPTMTFDPAKPLDPAACGGNAFDLADLGLTEARYLRIVDLDGGGEAPSAGFDLDAVGLLHHSLQ